MLDFSFRQPFGGFTDNSFIDTTAAPILGDIDPNQIFDGSFIMGLSSDQHLYLVKAFYDNYGHRQVCHESLFTWRNMVRGRYIAIRDRYDRLFKTLDLIENPLATFYEKETEDNRKQDTRKKYGTDTRRTDGNAVNQTSNTGRTSGEDWGDNEGYSQDRELETSQNKSESKQATGQNVASTDYHLQTDTPQTGFPGAVVDGSVYGQDSAANPAVGDADAAKHIFNEGYLTNGEKDTHNERITGSTHGGNSGASASDSERQGRTGQNTYNYTEGTSNNSALSNNTTQDISTGNQTESEGGNENEQRTRIREGFEDESVSELLTQYRETCIMATGQFLLEFNDLFISVY